MRTCANYSPTKKLKSPLLSLEIELHQVQSKVWKYKQCRSSDNYSSPCRSRSNGSDDRDEGRDNLQPTQSVNRVAAPSYISATNAPREEILEQLGIRKIVIVVPLIVAQIYTNLDLLHWKRIAKEFQKHG